MSKLDLNLLTSAKLKDLTEQAIEDNISILRGYGNYCAEYGCAYNPDELGSSGPYSMDCTPYGGPAEPGFSITYYESSCPCCGGEPHDEDVSIEGAFYILLEVYNCTWEDIDEDDLEAIEEIALDSISFTLDLDDAELIFKGKEYDSEIKYKLKGGEY